MGYTTIFNTVVCHVSQALLPFAGAMLTTPDYFLVLHERKWSSGLAAPPPFQGWR